MTQILMSRDEMIDVVKRLYVIILLHFHALTFYCLSTFHLSYGFVLGFHYIFAQSQT